MLIKKYILIIAILFISSFEQYTFASSLPVGFENAFELNETKIKIKNLDGSFSQSMVFSVSFNTIQLDSENKKTVKQFREYLKINNVSEKYEEQIISDLIYGVKSVDLCTGSIKGCQLSPETYEFIYDYNDKVLYFYVSPDLLSYKNVNEEKKYHSSESEKNGLINSFDLYASSYYQQDAVVSLNDRATLGLPYGYLRGDVNLNNSEDSSQIYEAAYHLDFDAYTLKMGYFKYDPNINSTDFLNSTALFSQNSIIFASSENLLIGNKNSNKVLNIYAAKTGRIHVYRDDRLIYQRNSSEGQNTINYADLPYGRYKVKVDVLSSGKVINSQIYNVYNNRNDSLAEGGIDFSLSAGLLSDQRFEDDLDNQNVDNSTYTKGLVSYQWIDSLLLGAGGIISQEGNSTTIGASYSWLETGLETEIVYDMFKDAEHLNINMNILGLNISYETLETDTLEDGTLAHYLYGERDYIRGLINYSYSFGGGKSLYTTYSHIKYSSEDGFDLDNEDAQNFVSIGYSSPFIASSNLNLNLDYTDTSDDLTFNILWSIPLSENLEVSTGTTTSKSEVTQFITNIRKDNIIDSDSFHTEAELSNVYNRSQDDMYQEARASASGRTQYATMNMSAYASNNDNSMGVSGGFSSTQIITKDDIYITSKESLSYAVIDIEDNNVNEMVQNDAKGYLSLNKNDSRTNKKIIYKDEAVIPLSEYDEYAVKFDAESVDLYNSGEHQLKVFSHPGTVATMSPKVNRVVSFITSFNDLSEKPVNDVLCVGDGCLNVSEIADGIYRITVLDGIDFELTSNSNSCLLPYEFTTTNQMNFGENYCLPLANSNEELELIDIDDSKLKAIFLGAYEQSSEVEGAIENLKSVGYRVIEKRVGNLKAIYIAQIPSKIKELLAESKDSIQKFKLLSKNNYSAENISFPVALLN